ncbi:hypothetical protein L204_100820 [Cryptococcus depauperatus]
MRKFTSSWQLAKRWSSSVVSSRLPLKSQDAKRNRDFMEGLVKEMEALRAKGREGGGKEVLASVAALLDPASPFAELSPLAGHEVYGEPLPGAGLVTGIGMVAGRKCMIVANDPTVKGGAYYPLTVGVGDERRMLTEVRSRSTSGPRRWHWRIVCLASTSSSLEAPRCPTSRKCFQTMIFYNMARMSGLGIPQISVVHGISVAGGAYMPAMSDVNQGRIFLAGPPLVKAATGEVVDEESLGGGEMHTMVSGVADYLATSDSHAIRLAREAMRDVSPSAISLPVSGSVARPPLYPAEELDAIVPADPRQNYDPREIIARLVDGSEFREFKEEYGKTIITGFAEIHGYTVGIVANAGVLLSPSALKATHFINLCSQRQIPLVFLVNVNGYMVGEKAERGGIAKDGAKMVRAVARAKVENAGNYGMCGRAYSPRFLFMWPNAKICVMGPDQLSSVMHTVQGKRDKAREEQEGEKEKAEKERKRQELKEKIEKQSTSLYSTARIWDDGIIKPSDTRDLLGLGLELAHEERATRKASIAGHGSRGEIGADGDAGDWGVFRF